MEDDELGQDKFIHKFLNRRMGKHFIEFIFKSKCM